MTVCDGGEGGGLSWRDVTFVIKIHCRGAVYLTVTTVIVQVQRLYVNRRSDSM